MMEYIPENRTVLYLTRTPEGPKLTENFVMYYLGGFGVYVISAEEFDKDFALLKVAYSNEDLLKELYLSDDHPIRVRRVFKHGGYSDDADGADLNGLFAHTLANLTGMLDGKDAVVKVISDAKAIRDKFVNMAMEPRDSDVEFDLDGENVRLYIKVVPGMNKIWVIIWVEGLDDLY